MNAPLPRPRLPEDQETTLRNFFEEYARTFQDALRTPPVLRPRDVQRCFADKFVLATPQGVHSGKNGVLFRWLIPRTWAFYRKIGVTSMSIADLWPSATDERHVLVRVRWAAEYVRPKDGVSGHVEFDNSYWLDTVPEPRIFACVTPDETAILKEHGLVPA